MPKDARRLTELAEEANGEESELLEHVIGLRTTLRLRRRWELLWRTLVTFAVIILFLQLGNILSGRNTRTQAICAGFQAYTSALVSQAPADQQDKVRVFIDEVNRKLSPLGCHITAP